MSCLDLRILSTFDSRLYNFDSWVLQRRGLKQVAMCQIPDPHLPGGKWEMGIWDLGVGVDLSRGVAVAGGS